MSWDRLGNPLQIKDRSYISPDEERSMVLGKSLGFEIYFTWNTASTHLLGDVKDGHLCDREAQSSKVQAVVQEALSLGPYGLGRP